MDGARLDRLARAVATGGSRRRVVGAVLAGVLGSLRPRTTAADDSGATIADASGGDQNRATVVDPATNRNDHDRDRNRDRDREHDQKKCQPQSRSEACAGHCDQVVNDGCGGSFDCTCDGQTVCARRDGVCCQPERLCDEKRVCCQGSDTCAPEDICCPPERLCLPSNRCCPVGEVCARGGGVCCTPQQVCRVGGVANACCTGTCNAAGVCV
jgi:hypothetical protein